jgi:hypothetical protein
MSGFTFNLPPTRYPFFSTISKTRKRREGGCDETAITFVTSWHAPKNAPGAQYINFPAANMNSQPRISKFKKKKKWVKTFRLSNLERRSSRREAVGAS